MSSSIYSLSQVYGWDFDSDFNTIETGKKYIWATLENKTLVMIDRSDYKKVQRIRLHQQQTSLPKLVVDKMGDNCAIIYENGDVYHVSSEFFSFTELKYPRSSIATCGTWVEYSNKTSLILCTARGEVLQIYLKSLGRCGFIYALPKPERINAITILTGEITFIFLLMQNRIIYFHGTESLEIVFSNGAANHYFMLSPGTPEIKRPIQTAPNSDENCILVTPYANGIMIFEAVNTDNAAKVSFSQTFIAQNVREKLQTLDVIKWGVLVSYKSFVCFYSFSGTQAIVNFPDTHYVYGDEKELILCNGVQLCVTNMKIFREFVAMEAIEKGDYELAEFIGKGVIDIDKILFEKLIKMKPETASEIIMKKNFTLEQILVKFKGKSKILIACLEKFAEKVPKSKPKQKLVIYHLILSFYCFIYPKSKSKMVEFITKNKRELNFNKALNQLREFEIYEGIEALCDPKSDKESLIDLYIARRETPKIFEIINQEFDEQFIQHVLIRVLPFAKQEIGRFLEANRVIRYSVLLPILATDPNFVLQGVTSDLPNSDTDTLVYMAYSSLGMDDRIIKKMSRGYSDAAFLLRTCMKYDLLGSVSRLWLDLGKIELAIEYAMKKDNKNGAYSIINSLYKPEERRRAWLKVLQLTANEDKKKVIDQMLKNKIFSFDELIEFVSSDELTAMYTDLLLETAEACMKQSEFENHKTYDEKPKHRNISLTFNSECCLCGEMLAGSSFVAFQCGHLCHADCVKKFYDYYVEKDIIYNTDPFSVEDSCPICGYVSISSIMESY